MKTLCSIALAMACQPSEATVSPQPLLEAPARTTAFDHTHAEWDAILREHVQGDRFDYGALAKAPLRLDTYLADIHTVTPSELAGWSREERFAFWLNVYNAWTIKKVVDNYPLKSIRKLDKFLGAKTVFEQSWIHMEPHHPGGDEDELSLNDIEHGILRGRFGDARLHAAINCASISCPPLRAEAFVANRLDEQLTEQMRNFVVDAERMDYDVEDGVLRLSEIFKWFKEDFEKSGGSVRDFIASFAPEDKRAFIKKAKIKYLDYDWDLNDVE